MAAKGIRTHFMFQVYRSNLLHENGDSFLKLWDVHTGCAGKEELRGGGESHGEAALGAVRWRSAGRRPVRQERIQPQTIVTCKTNKYISYSTTREIWPKIPTEVILY